MSGEAVKMECEIVWNIIPEFTARANVGVEEVKRRALEKIAELARERVAVETGETRDSIRVVDDYVDVGGAGLFLEHGTRNMAPEPFLLPSAEEVQRTLGAEYAAMMNGAGSPGQ